MVEAMHQVVLRAIKVAVDKSFFLAVSCDEVTSIDNHSWLFMHVYVIDNWKHVVILLNLQKLDGTTFYKLVENIVTSLAEYRGVREADLVQKLMYFGGDGATIFYNAKIGVITQLMQKHAPHNSSVP
jgi:hypothetical protein